MDAFQDRRVTGIPSFLIDLFLDRKEKRKATDALMRMYQGMEKEGPTESGGANYGSNQDTVMQAQNLESIDPRKAYEFLLGEMSPDTQQAREAKRLSNDKIKVETDRDTFLLEKMRGLVAPDSSGLTPRGSAALLYGPDVSREMYPSAADATGKVNIGLYTPESAKAWQDSISAANPAGDTSLLRPRAESVRIGDIEYIREFDENGRPVMTPVMERGAQLTDVKDSAGAETKGKNDQNRLSELPQIMRIFEDEEARINSLLSRLESGEISTGRGDIILGATFNTDSYNAGKQAETVDAISAINEATFGALSKSELDMLRGKDFSMSASEEENKRRLRRRREKMIKRRQELLREYRALSSGRNYVPQSFDENDPLGIRQ